jgi:hypothetical protein
MNLDPMEPKQGGSDLGPMAQKAERDRARPKGNGAADRTPAPDELEKERLRFELELLQSQDAGASLDPLLRGPRSGAGEVDPGRGST